MTFAKDMPMNAISRWIDEHDKRLWRILHYYVVNAVVALDLSHVTKIGTDETSSKRGHNYVTLFMDAEKKYVIYATKRKDSSILKVCKEQLEAHGGNADKVEEFCMNMFTCFY
jgi:transposase